MAKENARKAGVNMPAKRAAFLKALGLGLKLVEACGIAGINRNLPATWRASDPTFDEEYRQALAAGVGYLALEARRRAVEGVRKPVIQQGRVVREFNATTGELEPVWLYEYSDTLLMFLLKARDPTTYDDRMRAEFVLRKWRKRDGGGDSNAVPASAVIELLGALAASKAAGAEPAAQ